MKTKASQNAKFENDGDEAKHPERGKPALTGCASFLEETSLLEEEDGHSYQQVLDAIVAETDAQSFLGRVAAKDYADKLFEERRCKSAVAELLDAARSCSFGPFEDEQKLAAIEKYLPLLAKFYRIIDSSQAGRRALLKELVANRGAPNSSAM